MSEKNAVDRDLRKALAKMAKPESANPRKPKECKPHEYLTSDRCYWCGAPMPVRRHRSEKR